MQAEYGDKVEFIVVYIREAHALDGASPRGVGGDHPIVEEPLTIDERLTVAKRCDAKLDLTPFTVVIDDIEDTANTSYAAHPDRLYLVDKEGRVAYAGGRGPRALGERFGPVSDTKIHPLARARACVYQSLERRW